MQTLLTWIGCGLCGVLFVACVVAWYEHLGRERRWQDEPDWESPTPKAVSVDVELEPPAEGDQDERRQALGGALARMTATDTRARFGDTKPMILPGRSDEAAPAVERRKRGETTPG